MVVERERKLRAEDGVSTIASMRSAVYQSFSLCTRVIFSKTLMSHGGLWQRLSVGADVKL